MLLLPRRRGGREEEEEGWRVLQSPLYGGSWSKGAERSVGWRQRSSGEEARCPSWHHQFTDVAPRLPPRAKAPQEQCRGAHWIGGDEAPGRADALRAVHRCWSAQLQHHGVHSIMPPAMAPLPAATCRESTRSARRGPLPKACTHTSSSSSELCRKYSSQGDEEAGRGRKRANGRCRALRVAGPDPRVVTRRRPARSTAPETYEVQGHATAEARASITRTLAPRPGRRLSRQGAAGVMSKGPLQWSG